jgi:mRNA interferase RelE/StbE
LKVLYAKNFLKDLAQVPNPDRERIEIWAFHELSKYETISSVGKIEKLQGFKNHFKIRFGNYRIGIHVIDNTVTFERVLHRKEIYRYFP